MIQSHHFIAVWFDLNEYFHVVTKKINFRRSRMRSYGLLGPKLDAHFGTRAIAIKICERNVVKLANTAEFKVEYYAYGSVNRTYGRKDLVSLVCYIHKAYAGEWKDELSRRERNQDDRLVRKSFQTVKSNNSIYRPHGTFSYAWKGCSMCCHNSITIERPSSRSRTDPSQHW